MGVLILVLVAVIALSGSDPLELNHPRSMTQTDEQADEGNISQIFGSHQDHSQTVSVIVEAPLAAAPVPCNTAELVRDLTVPYSQRTYIRHDGTSCTPVE